MSDHRPTDPRKLQRQKRLEETLKENLRRRKAQARARVDLDRPSDQDEADAEEGRKAAPRNVDNPGREP